jgi:hypothetical protein
MSERILDVSPAKLVLILAGTFLVLAAAAWIMLIGPKESKVSSLETTIQSAQTQLNKLAHDEPAARKHAVSQTLLLSRALPNEVGMPQIVLQLSRVANEEHVSLDSITPQTPISYSGYQALPIAITLSGNFFAIESFLEQLRNQVQLSGDGIAATGRLYDVLGVTLQASTPAPKVTATITLDAFSYTGIATTPGGAPTTTTSSG